MLINGKAAIACSSLIDKLEQPVRLEPLSRFPVIRDLAVDRSVLFENLKRVRAWVWSTARMTWGQGRRFRLMRTRKCIRFPAAFPAAYSLEVCPQVTPLTGFMGAAIINQVRLF
jgi:succinate dehydrogenase / fumarate reductase iron-sulfur subunit